MPFDMRGIAERFSRFVMSTTAVSESLSSSKNPRESNIKPELCVRAS